ncbi:MAG: alpha/beta hydrolase [Acidobacteriota bacterium]
MRRTTILSIAFSLIAIANAGLSQTNPAQPGLMQPKPAHNFFTTSDGIKIHYMVMGKGTPVVLIHGYTGSAEGNWFRNGVADALARTNLVVALDCRNHGKSDKPQLNGPGRAEDVVELIDHLKIQKAHFHGYSMGGSIVAQLMVLIPDRMITAGFGGSGVPEVEADWREKVPADKQGRDPQEEEASRNLRIRHAMDNGATREEAEKQADTPRPPRTPPAQTSTQTSGASTPRPQPTGPQLDLTKIFFPVLAINGEYDRPLAKTHRMWRELRTFRNVVLPGKSHLTAISPGYIPKEYVESVVDFVNDYNPRK